MTATDVHNPPRAFQDPSSLVAHRVGLSQTKPHVEPLNDVTLLAAIALDLARTNGKVTADDLRRLTPNAKNKSTVYGAAFRLLIQQGKLVLVTYQPSQTPGNNGRRIGVYSCPIQPNHRVCP